MAPITVRDGALLLLATCGFALNCVAQATPEVCRASSAAAVPTVVELYTSEGCNSCPPADKWLASLKDEPGIVRLAFHVDYWDRLGWKDRFADPAYTRRQYTVMQHSGARFVYTPQVIINGADDRRWPMLPNRSAPPAMLSVSVTRDGGAYVAQLVRGPGAPQHLAAYWAVTEDGLVSEVKSGENRGATLHHDAVVRDYLAIPEVGAAPLRFEPRPAQGNAGNRRVLLVVINADSGKPVQAVGC